MKTIKVHVSTNRVGSGDYREFEVDDEAPLGEIEEKEEFNYIKSKNYGTY